MPGEVSGLLEAADSGRSWRTFGNRPRHERKGPTLRAQNNATRRYFLRFAATSAAARTARREYRARGSRSAALAIRAASSDESRNVITCFRLAAPAFAAVVAFFLLTDFLAMWTSLMTGGLFPADQTFMARTARESQSLAG